MAMNIVQVSQGHVLGLEEAGIVRQIELQVKTFRVDDRNGCSRSQNVCHYC